MKKKKIDSKVSEYYRKLGKKSAAKRHAKLMGKLDKKDINSPNV